MKFVKILAAFLVALGAAMPPVYAVDPSGDTGSQASSTGQSTQSAFPGVIPESRPTGGNWRSPNMTILGGTLSVNKNSTAQWNNVPSLVLRPNEKSGSSLDTTVVWTTPTAARKYTIPDMAGDANFLLGAAQTIAGVQTFSSIPIFPLGGITFKGTSFNTTLKALNAMGQALTVTIPDPGAATANVVLDAGAQTITGVKTFADQALVNTMGTGPAPYNASGVLNLQVNSFSTAAGTGAQTGHTYTLPASSLIDTGRGIKITAWGHTAANANNKTIAIVFGTTTYTTGAVAANAKDYYLEVTVVRTGASAQTWLASGYFNAVPLSFAGSATTGTITQTETGTLAVSTALTDGTSSAGDIVESGFRVDAI